MLGKINYKERRDSFETNDVSVDISRAWIRNQKCFALEI